MSELKELPHHDGAWDMDYWEASYPNAADALEACGIGEIVGVQLYTLGPSLWGFQHYDEEKDECKTRWFDDEIEAQRAYDAHFNQPEGEKNEH